MEKKYIVELINVNISDTILNCYYGLTYQPRDLKEINPNYVGKLHRYNNPFQYRVYGAYHLKHYYELLEYQIRDGYFQKRYGVSESEIQDALKVYGENFVVGFDNFEKDVVKGKSSLFTDRSDYCQTIFDYALGATSRPGGYPETIGGGRHVFSAFDTAGKEMGYFYRSWYIILENYKAFENLFEPQVKRSDEEFLQFFIRGIYSLQKQDVNAECVRNIKNANCKNEHEFRNWFTPWFESKYASVSAEPEKGNGRIDLKIEDPTVGTKIVEFKGWWNNDKKNLINQLTDYLTEFDSEGYIFMINHLKNKNIVERYKEIIMSPETKCLSWDELPYLETGYKYYVSRHAFGQEKTIYHVIYGVHK
jgi:hypothetical protein